MKKFIIILCTSLLVGSAFFFKDYFISTPTIKEATGKAISQMEYLTIGGIPQFVLIRSYNLSNPVLLFIHGGPGSSETAMFRKYNEVLEKDFTVVYWDQRGAAKSYSEEVDPETLHLEQYLADTKELIHYLRERFQQEKVYVLGHSWGSTLGLLTSFRHPELVKAFISVGQVVHTSRGHALSYSFCLEKAKETNNAEAVAELEAIGAPMAGTFSNPEDFGIMRKWLLKLGGERYGRAGYSDMVLAILLSPEYSVLDIHKYLKGMELSYRMMETVNNLNFFEEVKELKVPAYFIAGTYDYVTPVPLIKQYAKYLSGPEIHYKEFEKSSHSPMYEQPELFNQYLLEIKKEVESRH